jgi:Chaperone of endosialidase
MKAIVLSARSHLGEPSLRKGSLLIAFLLACLGLTPMAQAVGPDTEGNIPGANNGEGVGVLVSRTTGVWNTGTGFEALNHLTAGNQNTATGLRALFSDTNGGFNTATGVYSLFGNTSGFFNSATGAYALAHNTTGGNNTANGYSALYFNTQGEFNTATGFAALYRNTIGNYNTAIGHLALHFNTQGEFNTAIGNAALFHNTLGNDNTANGDSALFFNTEGEVNTATGFLALYHNTTGSDNTAIGSSTLAFNTTGNENTALGIGAGNAITTANNVICIGANVAGADVSNSCFIGNIRGVTTAIGDAIPVVIDSVGQLGTMSSSKRFKKEIKPMDQMSEAILALKPVTFHYKSDKAGTPQFGLIAEEVAQVNPDLVVRDESGEVYSVRYDAVNAMLLNEFLKEHRRFQEQNRKVEQQEAAIFRLKQDLGAKIAQQAKQIEALVATVKEQATQIQKVSAQIEAGKPLPQTVLNNR